MSRQSVFVPGEVHGWLTAIRRYAPPNHLFALYRCECGTKKKLRIKSVKSSKPQSCGCRRHFNARNHLITFNGATANITQWAAHLGIPRKILYSRIHAGWPAEEALTTVYRKKP